MWRTFPRSTPSRSCQKDLLLLVRTAIGSKMGVGDTRYKTDNISDMVDALCIDD